MCRGSEGAEGRWGAAGRIRRRGKRKGEAEASPFCVGEGGLGQRLAGGGHAVERVPVVLLDAVREGGVVEVAGGGLAIGDDVLHEVLEGCTRLALSGPSLGMRRKVRVEMG